MEMNFKQYIESYAEMGYHLGSENVFDSLPLLITNEEIENIIKYGKQSLNLLNKIDKVVGMKKMFLLLGPTTSTLLNTGLALSKVARHPKKLYLWIALKDDVVELAKLAAMNPLVAGPIAIGMTKLVGLGEKQESVILMTKLASSIYFYLSSIIKMMENSKLEQVRKMALLVKDKVEKLMPKSELPH